ncbi:MAG: glycosyltransferase [Caldilineaceae bacterium]|nr:glycosyltransferase [Caldilineaceae bacterium]
MKSDMYAVNALLETLYGICVVALALYGFHNLWLSACYLLRPARKAQAPDSTFRPNVTVQLPIYNEQHVAERLIDACAQLNYPPDKLQIQVLDDSDDGTTALVYASAQTWQQQGINVEVVRRETRTGYKAGALAYALPLATGDYIAIFDADFVPPPDFLQRTMPYFGDYSNADVGFVQARWGHINRTYSWLTRCQALALDGHFVVEQTARDRSGYPFGFNGSAGIWRRECLEDPQVGGWQPDTLCEDLDLSYRAQMAGWQGLYAGSLEVPAEVPVQLLAFKRQQFRWAKGTIQTLRKLGRRVASHAAWSPVTRIAAFAHLTSYLIHPLLLLMLLVTLPMLLWDIDPARPLAYLSIFSFGPPLLYALAQKRLAPERWFLRWAWLPLLMLMGTGLTVNNTLAVFQGFRQQGGAFLRTPKFRIDPGQSQWQQSGYQLPLQPMVIGEFFFFLYAIATIIVAWAQGHYGAAPFLAIYAAGFGLMVGVELWQAWRSRSARDNLRRQRDRARLRAEADRIRG